MLSAVGFIALELMAAVFTTREVFYKKSASLIPGHLFVLASSMTFISAACSHFTVSRQLNGILFLALLLLALALLRGVLDESEVATDAHDLKGLHVPHQADAGK